MKSEEFEIICFTFFYRKSYQCVSNREQNFIYLFFYVVVSPLSQLRFNPKGAPRKDLGDVLKPLLDSNLDA